MNPAKRRRLDANASTLRKPFRSPLKLPISGQAAYRPDTTRNLEQQTPDSIPTIGSSPLHDSPVEKSQPKYSPSRPSSTVELSTLTDDVTTLQKQYSALTQKLRKLRQDLDVAEQAQKLHSNSQGEQLKSITARWRDLARSAADQVFEFSCERIKEMGGIRTWQQSTQESSQSWFDHEPSRQEDCHDRVDRDEIDEHSSNTVSTRSKEKDEEDNKQSEVRPTYFPKIPLSLIQDQQTFTMSTMLQQMNIDPDLLGYDEPNEQWTD